MLKIIAITTIDDFNATHTHFVVCEESEVEAKCEKYKKSTCVTNIEVITPINENGHKRDTFPSVSFMREDLIEHLGEERAMALTDEEMERISSKVGDHILEYYEWQDDLNDTADFVLGD